LDSMREHNQIVSTEASHAINKIKEIIPKVENIIPKNHNTHEELHEQGIQEATKYTGVWASKGNNANKQAIQVLKTKVLL
jgi:hypothetical protein